MCCYSSSSVCNQRHFTCQLGRERAARLGLAVAMAVAREALGRMLALRALVVEGGAKHLFLALTADRRGCV